MAAGIRFVQCGGFQFDSPSWEGPEEWISMRCQDLWQTFEAVLGLCQREKVDCLFLTGNLFDQDYVRKETVDRVVNGLANLRQTRVFITPGERDPLVRASAYRLAIWPQNVHIFSKDITSVTIPDLNLTIYGAGWSSYRQEISFLDSFHVETDGTLKFMLLHAVVGLNENLAQYKPLSTAEIAASGLNYLALGQREEWSGVQQCGETLWADSGFPEARSFRSADRHGVVLGEIVGEKLSQFEFCKLGQRCCVERALSIQGQESLEDLVVRFLEETSGFDRLTDLFRIKLIGVGTELEMAAVVSQLCKLLAGRVKYLDLVPFKEDYTLQFNEDISALEMQSRGEIEVGFPTLRQVADNYLKERTLLIGNDEEVLERWELVQKITLSAFEQGRINDED